MITTTPAFAVDALTVRYGERAAVDGVDLVIPSGAVTAIIGPNGCGKSTLLRTLAGLIRAESGGVVVGGDDLSRIPPRAYARRVAMLPQAPTAPDGLRVVDLVSRGRDPHRRWFEQWSRHDEGIVAETLAATGLLDLADRPLESLSGGQRQRAWIAMIVAQRTGILLLDEPTTYLDIAHQLEVLELVRALHVRDGVTVVMVMHELTMAARFADHLVAMDAGRVVATGEPGEVLKPDILAAVFGIEADVIVDPRSGRPIVVPVGPVGPVGPVDPREATP